MIEKCLVKVVGNRVVCDTTTDIKKHEKEEKDKMNELVKNKRKLNHLEGIGMDLGKYHPTVIRTMIDGGRNFRMRHILRGLILPYLAIIQHYINSLKQFIKYLNAIMLRKLIP